MYQSRLLVFYPFEFNIFHFVSIMIFICMACKVDFQEIEIIIIKCNFFYALKKQVILD